MMIVSNQIETGKVQYVWMAFSHQTAPRSRSSLNISQILLFSNVPLLSSKYRLLHNCPKRKKYFYTIVAGAEQKLFRLWVGGRYSICIFCGTGGLVFPFVFSVWIGGRVGFPLYFLYGLVGGWVFPCIFCMDWWAGGRVFYSRITCLTHVTYITLAFSSPHIGFSFSICFNQMVKKQ